MNVIPVDTESSIS